MSRSKKTALKQPQLPLLNHGKSTIQDICFRVANAPLSLYVQALYLKTATTLEYNQADKLHRDTVETDRKLLSSVLAFRKSAKQQQQQQSKPGPDVTDPNLKEVLSNKKKSQIRPPTDLPCAQNNLYRGSKQPANLQPMISSHTNVLNETTGVDDMNAKLRVGMFGTDVQPHLAFVNTSGMQMNEQNPLHINSQDFSFNSSAALLNDLERNIHLQQLFYQHQFDQDNKNSKGNGEALSNLNNQPMQNEKPVHYNPFGFNGLGGHSFNPMLDQTTSTDSESDLHKEMNNTTTSHDFVGYGDEYWNPNGFGSFGQNSMMYSDLSHNYDDPDVLNMIHGGDNYNTNIDNNLNNSNSFQHLDQFLLQRDDLIFNTTFKESYDNALHPNNNDMDDLYEMEVNGDDMGTDDALGHAGKNNFNIRQQLIAAQLALASFTDMGVNDDQEAVNTMVANGHNSTISDSTIKTIRLHSQKRTLTKQQILQSQQQKFGIYDKNTVLPLDFQAKHYQTQRHVEKHLECIMFDPDQDVYQPTLSQELQVILLFLTEFDNTTNASFNIPSSHLPFTPRLTSESSIKARSEINYLLQQHEYDDKSSIFDPKINLTNPLHNPYYLGTIQSPTWQSMMSLIAMMYLLRQDSMLQSEYENEVQSVKKKQQLSNRMRTSKAHQPTKKDNDLSQDKDRKQLKRQRLITNRHKLYNTNYILSDSDSDSFEFTTHDKSLLPSQAKSHHNPPNDILCDDDEIVNQDVENAHPNSLLETNEFHQTDNEHPETRFSESEISYIDLFKPEPKNFEHFTNENARLNHFEQKLSSIKQNNTVFTPQIINWSQLSSLNASIHHLMYPVFTFSNTLSPYISPHYHLTQLSLWSMTIIPPLIVMNTDPSMSHIVTNPHNLPLPPDGNEDSDRFDANRTGNNQSDCGTSKINNACWRVWLGTVKQWMPNEMAHNLDLISAHCIQQCVQKLKKQIYSNQVQLNQNDYDDANNDDNIAAYLDSVYTSLSTSQENKSHDSNLLTFGSYPTESIMYSFTSLGSTSESDLQIKEMTTNLTFSTNTSKPTHGTTTTTSVESGMGFNDDDYTDNSTIFDSNDITNIENELDSTVDSNSNAATFDTKTTVSSSIRESHTQDEGVTKVMLGFNTTTNKFKKHRFDKCLNVFHSLDSHHIDIGLYLLKEFESQQKLQTQHSQSDYESEENINTQLSTMNSGADQVNIMPILFSSVIGNITTQYNRNRAHIAQLFVALLTLNRNQIICLEQNGAYNEISITPGNVWNYYCYYLLHYSKGTG